MGDETVKRGKFGWLDIRWPGMAAIVGSVARVKSRPQKALIALRNRSLNF